PGQFGRVWARGGGVPTPPRPPGAERHLGPVHRNGETHLRARTPRRQVCGDCGADRFVPVRGPTSVGRHTKAAGGREGVPDRTEREGLLVVGNAGRVLVRLELDLATEFLCFSADADAGLRSEPPREDLTGLPYSGSGVRYGRRAVAVAGMVVARPGAVAALIGGDPGRAPARQVGPEERDVDPRQPFARDRMHLDVEHDDRQTGQLLLVRQDGG